MLHRRRNESNARRWSVDIYLNIEKQWYHRINYSVRFAVIIRSRDLAISFNMGKPKGEAKGGCLPRARPHQKGRLTRRRISRRWEEWKINNRNRPYRLSRCNATLTPLHICAHRASRSTARLLSVRLAACRSRVSLARMGARARGRTRDCTSCREGARRGQLADSASAVRVCRHWRSTAIIDSVVSDWVPCDCGFLRKTPSRFQHYAPSCTLPRIRKASRNRSPEGAGEAGEGKGGRIRQIGNANGRTYGCHGCRKDDDENVQQEKGR